MKEIHLPNGMIAIVDETDYERLSKFAWFAAQKVEGGAYYVHRRTPKSIGSQRIVSMAREILGVTDRKIQVDHLNHNTLDNRRVNLRECSQKENLCNRRHKRRKLNVLKGVYVCGKGYVASISVDGKTKYLGYKRTPEDAARAYDDAALKYHGEFACLNFSSKTENE